jgi:hypothetical protein
MLLEYHAALAGVDGTVLRGAAGPMAMRPVELPSHWARMRRPRFDGALPPAADDAVTSLGTNCHFHISNGPPRDLFRVKGAISWD